MILSVYSAAASPAELDHSDSKKEKDSKLLFPFHPNAQLDNQIYLAHAKLIYTPEELSKWMGMVHNTLMRYLVRQSYSLVSRNIPPEDAGVDVDKLLTRLQARLFAATKNKLHVTIIATPLQRKLAHGTYTLYLRALVAMWRCIMSVAEVANKDMMQVNENEFIQQVLYSKTHVNVTDDTTRTFNTYHAQVQQCVDKVEHLRKVGMQQLWAPFGTSVSIPLDLHMNMFKNYLSQVRAWLQQQPTLALL